MNSNSLLKMGSRSIVSVGIYALIYLHTTLGDGIVSRDGLSRGVLPSGILKIEKYCPGLKVRSPFTFSFRITFSHESWLVIVYFNQFLYELEPDPKFYSSTLVTLWFPTYL